MESSRRDLFIDIDIDRLIFKDNQIQFYLCFTLPKTGMHLKQD